MTSRPHALLLLLALLGASCSSPPEPRPHDVHEASDVRAYIRARRVLLDQSLVPPDEDRLLHWTLMGLVASLGDPHAGLEVDEVSVPALPAPGGDPARAIPPAKDPAPAFEPAHFQGPVRWARSFEADPRVGYLHLPEFTEETPRAFDAAVDRLLASGSQALVLDLRNNPGGDTSACDDVKSRFLSRGTIGVSWYRDRGRIIRRADPELTRYEGLPLVILLDRGSASAAEDLAGALKARDAAEIVGERSYGKGSIQRLVRVSERGPRLRFTVGRFYTPNDRPIDRGEAPEGRHGIAPDHPIPLEDGLREAIWRHLAGIGELPGPAPIEVDPQLATALGVAQEALGGPYSPAAGASEAP